MGAIHGRFDRVGGERRWAYRLAGQAAVLTLDIAPFAIGNYAASPGDSLVAEARAGSLRVRLVSSTGAVKEEAVLPPSPERAARQTALDAIFAGTAFATPAPLESHPVMSHVYRRDQGR
jgi:hypothetical protein